MDAGLERYWGSQAPDLRIGLVNNSPLGAFATTERQFASLLRDAAGGGLDLHVFSLPGVLDAGAAQHPAVAHCEAIEAIGDLGLHAFVVTGAEPCTQLLSDEPFWKPLTSLLDWAEARAVPVALSCLAAHAGVLHQAGILRRRLPEKRFGVFAHQGDPTQTLMHGHSGRYLAPHSRWNDVSADALQKGGYDILSHAPEAGVDLFSSRTRPGWLYLQGHPEYRPHTLVSQFRRDFSRFSRGEIVGFPPIPVGVFSEETIEALQRMRQDAPIGDSRALPELAEILPENLWRANAVRLFANWIRHAAVAGRSKVAIA